MLSCCLSCCLTLSLLQERQRLETILSLCSELGHVENGSGVSAASDLQKINRELEKLQVSDDESSVFSDSLSSAPENVVGLKGRGELQPQRQRRLSGNRDARPQSPTNSLRSSTHSSSPHLQSKVRRMGSGLMII